MLSFFATGPVIIAVLLFILPFEKAARVIAAAAETALFGFAFYVFLQCKNGDITQRIGNYEGFLGIILTADTLACVFLMLCSLLFLIGTVYSFSDKHSRLFWFFLFTWQGLLNGVFLSNDMFNVFVLVEVATVVVAVLIMFNRDNRSMYDGMVYLMVNIVAMQFYLFGLGYLYKLTGTLDMTGAAEAAVRMENASLLLPFALIMTAISLKCALAPMFGWFTKAYTPSTPSAATALLSGIHAKVGVYLFIRFSAVFKELMLTDFFLIIGIITGVTGAVLALSQTDVRLILAYSTVSQIGLIMIGLNVSDIHFYAGGVYHIFNHAIFKSALFMCAGVLTKAYGTRDIDKIRGVLKEYPTVGAATAMAVLGIIGTPFFNGSVSKYFITSGAGLLVEGLVVFINLCTITVFIKYSAMLFGQAPDGFTKTKTDVFKQASVLFLGALCLAGGVFGEQAIKFLFGVDASIDAAGYAVKTGLFALSAAAGYLIYKHFVKRSKLFVKLRETDMGFRWICVSIGGFFALTLITAKLFAV